jgi:hypothetical protein
MIRSRVILVVVGMLMVMLGGGCKKNSTGPQAVQFPKNPVPADGATNQPLHLTLSWQDGDADHPAQSWDVCFGIYSRPPVVSSGQTTTSYDPGSLATGTTYHWKIVAKYNQGQETSGPEWTFTTGNGATPAPGYSLTQTRS